MKFLKLLTIFVLVMGVAIVIRAGLRKFTPGLYVAIWGGATIVETRDLANSSSSIDTVTKEKENEKPASTVSSSSEPQIFATGAVRRGRRILVQMSDGTVRTDLDNEPGRIRVSKVTSTFADIDGKRYHFKPSRAVEGVAADRRPLDAALVPPSPNGRAPVDGGETPAVASGSLAVGSWVRDVDGVQRLRETSSLSSAFSR